MDYITVKEASEKWNLSVRRIQTLCNENKIPNVKKFGREWAIPIDTKKPHDSRIKTGKYIKSEKNNTNISMFDKKNEEF
ncbi:DNA-binding protein [Tyzzerella sp. An114]|uniref:helix-turn-helix domain-containing protein n=1 Tax=Tyzzerella sp. An114 TaxID=1965545 RepID=UPI000B43568F|nr:helix-turn-helix domain-containing protein [Tyzzerella sp. An114]OUQ55026.1 DNA-binding protein [Tyzzerella sp. An114]